MREFAAGCRVIVTLHMRNGARDYLGTIEAVTLIHGHQNALVRIADNWTAWYSTEKMRHEDSARSQTK